MLSATIGCYAGIVEIDGIYYDLNETDRTAGVVQGSYSGEINIPASVSLDGTTYSVTRIETAAFSNCSDLTAISLPSSLTSIGEWAFSFTGLTSITLPASVESVGDGVFIYCDKLMSIQVSPGSAAFRSVDGVLYSKDKTTLYACPGGRTDAFSIPSTVKEIKNKAFYGCCDLTSITIPSSVASIGEEVFFDCASLTSIRVSPDNTAFCSEGDVLYDKGKTVLYVCPIKKTGAVTIPSTVTSIRSKAFFFCHDLTSIVIPEGVTDIGIGALSQCHGLTSITIPSSVTDIPELLFANCDGLQSITISKGAVNIGKGAFEGCRALTSVTLPSSLRYIGNYAFENCSRLQTLGIPEGVTDIDAAAFCMCYALTSVTLPSTLKSLGENAFRFCRNLLSVCSYSPVPPTADYSSFYNVGEAVTLYVPDGSVQAYRYAEGWSVIQDIQAFDATGISTVPVDRNAKNIYYDLNGCRLSAPKKGLNIVGGRKVMVK